jgi:Domain of unknown function (DUF1707)
MDDVRIGDSEREDGLHKLGEHLAHGRLDIDEHSERSSRILAARTRGDLRAVFADLPPPHPDLEHSLPATTADTTPSRTGAADRHPSTRRGRGAAVRAFAGELTAVVWVVSIVFLLARVGWWVILVPIAYSALLSAWSKAAGDHRAEPPPEPEQHPKPNS